MKRHEDSSPCKVETAFRRLSTYLSIEYISPTAQQEMAQRLAALLDHFTMSERALLK